MSRTQAVCPVLQDYPKGGLYLNKCRVFPKPDPQLVWEQPGGVRGGNMELRVTSQ